MVPNLNPLTGRSRRLFTAVLIISALSSQTPASAQDSTSVEYRVKAAFLLNFARFVEWPHTVFQNDKTPITVCIFRYDPFGSALDDIVRGKIISSRVLAVRRVTDLQELPSCNLVFVSDREARHLPEILDSLKGGSVLIIGETGDFAERGGSIHFFLEDNKLRFAVNLDSLARSRLTVSSKLLALAKIVHDQNFPKGS